MRNGFEKRSSRSELRTVLVNVLSAPGTSFTLVHGRAGTVEDPPPDPPHPLAGRLFPHIYGPLNRDAIVGAYPMPRGKDGTFAPPSR
jgi:hypothetical protein